MRLLVLEDDPLLGEALSTGLRQLGHVVDWFGDGTQADAAIDSASYDALVLDLGLPGDAKEISTMNVVRQLRNDIGIFRPPYKIYLYQLVTGYIISWRGMMAKLSKLDDKR